MLRAPHSHRMLSGANDQVREPGQRARQASVIEGRSEHVEVFD